jgi:hypothetical protein
MTEARNRGCLHCSIIGAIERHYSRYGERDRAGAVIMDMGEIVAKIGEVTGEMVCHSPKREVRRRYLRYAHECVDAGFRAAQGEGLQVVVQPGAEDEPVPETGTTH